MNVLLKHYLNTIFAFVLAIGVERLFHVLDPMMHEATERGSTDFPSFYGPLTLVLFTLLVCCFAATANERLVERDGETPVWDLRAWLAYMSVACMVAMFFFSVDFKRVRYWVFTYAALCFINAAWNFLSVHDRKARTRHVLVNVVIGGGLLSLAWFASASLQQPEILFLVLAPITAVKFWQRLRPRWPEEALRRGTA